VKERIVVRVEHLYKVFGDDPGRALPMLEAGKTKAEIREETGLTVGVNDVSFELEAGEIFVIMGLSGSGKSTLLRCINRLIEPLSGKVLLTTDEGEIDVASLDERELRALRRDRMSMVFQRFGLFPHRSVLDNVAYGQEVRGATREDRHRVAREMLDVVGLEGWGDSKPRELSGGMQQRVGLARALATQANVLLMDEPFSALDPLIKVNMQDELLRIQAELHRTILFITHDLDEALRIGTRVAIMDDGEIVQIGTPEEIIVEPRTEYVADFVEHADPTGVMRAVTVAVPVPGRRFEEVRREDGTVFYQRTGYPDTTYGLRDGRFAEMRVDGEAVEVVRLDDALEEETPAIRRRDAVLLCRPDATLKEVLRGRTYSRLPQVVADQGGRVLGVISENELVHGILYKRVNEEAVAARDASRAPAPTGR
jgi:glycine betaine/proline transport system ATP-binding protein